MSNLIIKNGRIIDPANGVDEIRDLFVTNGIITEQAPPDAEIIDAIGLIVSPGLIDLHVHFREPGQSHKETIASGARAAAAGGFTTVICMPNTTPSVDTPETVTWIQQEAAAKACINVFTTGALSQNIAGHELAPLETLAAAGVVAFTDDGRCIQDLDLMREAVMRVRALGLPIMEHCQDEALTPNSIMHEGEWSKRLGLAGWPREAEEVIVARDILLAEETGQPIHCQHISSKGSIRLLREARARGVLISGEASPHHITLTDEGLKNLDTNFKVNPPLRTQEDIDAIIAGIADGTISILASDHAPHAAIEKEKPIEQAPFGMLGLETELAVFLTVLFHQKKALSLSQLLEKLTINPARLLNLDRGTLSLGAPGDITLIDPNVEWTYDKETSFSLSRNTPFHGYHLQGRAVRTIVGGRTVWELK